MRTRAEQRGDTYVLNGQKIWITNGSVADVVCVFAVTDPEAGSRGITAFVVEKGTPGFNVGKLEKKMGIRGSPTVELIFDDCEVPAANRLGEEGEGFKIAMKVLDKSRPGIAAQALGIAAGALDYATQLCEGAHRVRQADRPASRRRIHARRHEDRSRGRAPAALRSGAALRRGRARTSRSGRRWRSSSAATSRCRSRPTPCRCSGGFGYSADYPVERMMRDAKITQIYEGTQQIQRLVIARNLVGRA